MEDNLQLAENLHRVYSQNDRCENCKTHIGQLKQEAIIMVQSMQQQTQDSLQMSPQVRTTQNATAGSPPSYQRSNRGQVIRLTTARPSLASCTATPSQMSQEYAEHKARMWGGNQKKYGQMNRPLPVGPNGPGGERFLSYTDPTMIPSANVSVDTRSGTSGHPRITSPPSSAYSSSPSRTGTVSVATSPMSQHSAAASFFARAAQKLSISSKKKKKYQSNEPELPIFPTSYSEVIRNNPPSAPPYLLRTAGRLQTPGVGKVKVMMRIFSPPNTGSHGEHGSLILSVDARKKQVTLHDPSASGYVSANRRTGVVAPKTFAFDAVFPQDDSLAEICSSSLTDIIQGVVNGADGCVFSFGYSRASKSHTMFGKDQSAQTLGLIPCAISWLFRLINEHRDATGARFSVRVSAVEVSGKQETLKDLLADVAQGTETGVATAPSVYLREDPICGTQLENQSELRAPTAEQAAYYLDAAIAARSTADEEEVRHSHLLFTLHIYQYRVEKVKSGLPGVAGGRSRLHFIDLGSCSKSKDPNSVSLSLSALGNVILALLNGQRHIPHRDAKIAQLLRDSLGNLSCRTCMIAHVSSAVAQYNETLQVIQLASRIHRMRRRKIKFSSTSSEDSSTDESGRLRRPLRGFRMGTLREDMLYSSSLSDPDYTSSSEQSCDTVIYVGINGHSLSDRELTDNESPPKAVPLLPRTNPRLPRRTSGSRSSGDEGSASDTGRTFSPVETGRLSISKIYGREPNTQTRIPMLSPTLTHGSNRDTSSPTGNTTPLSASSGYQIARRANLKQKIPSSKFKAMSDSGCSGRHQNNAEGPNFMEQWVDGPGAAIYPDRKNAELWIDGPQAFMVKMENGSRKHVRRESDENGRGRSWVMKRRNGNMSDGDIQPQRSASLQRDEREEEQWVDGPGRGNIRVSNNNYQNKQNAAASHGKKAASHIPQPAPASPPDPTPPPVSTVTTGTQSVVSHLRPNKHNQEPRPDSEMSADSLSAEPSDSRPVSLHSNEQPQQENEGNFPSKPVTAENEDGLNNFVKDWVERHHCNNNNINSSGVDTQEDPSLANYEDPDTGTIMDSEKQVLPTFESLSCYSKETVNAQTNQVAAMLHKTKMTPQETPIGPVHSTNRVTEWLKTVSTDDDRELCPSGSGSSGLSKSFLITESQLKDGSVTFETTNGNDDWRRNETVPLIETVSEFNKQMLMSDQCGDNKVWFTEEELTSEQKYLSFYSSADTNKDSNPETEFANLLISNRESIYEIQVDQQLERRSVSGGQDIPDDETFSSISCAKEDAEKLSLEAEAERIQTVQKLKALNTFQDDIPPVRETRAHCQFDRSKLSDLEEVSDEDSVLECKQQLLVGSGKPDNSSNSHLSKEIFDEEGGAIDVSVLKQNYTINPTMSGVYQTNSLFYERNSDTANSNSSSGAVGGHPLPNVNTVPNTLPMYSQIKSAKDGSGTNSQNDAKKSQKTKTSKSGSGHKTQPPSPPTIHKSTSRNQCKDTTSSSGNKQKNNKDSSPGCTAISSSVPSKLSAPPSSSSSSHASRGKDRGNKTGRSSSQPAVSTVTRNKTSKSQSPSRSRLPIFNGKGFAPTSKLKKKDKEKEKKEEKEKEKMAVIEKTCSPKIHEIDPRVPRREPDSGNDTGLVASEKKFLSPYATVTKPRVASHSSSGHGSDNSSTISTEVHSQLGSKSDKLHGGGTSSGYESMLRDSEATGSSSAHDDSASESSSNERKKGTRKKKVPGSRRSRSCPARSTSESPSVGRKECSGGQQVPPSPSSKAWVDTRQIHRLKEEPLEIRMYDSEDVERMQRRRQDEIEVYEQRRERVLELLNKQEELNQELVSAKDRLMIERSNWTFDLLPVEDVGYENASYLEILERETLMLQKRVEAFKSHLMIVTSFDVKV